MTATVESRPNSLPALQQNAHIGPIPSRATTGPDVQKQGPRIPPGVVRLATLRVRSEDAPDSPRKNLPLIPYKKVHTWEEAMTARPPLAIDMDGPTPCSYSPRCKPTMERNAPAYSFGRKTMPYKDGFGGRTAWSKQWFATPHIWCDKVNFHSERKWPAPNQYVKRQSLGSRQATAPAAPSFTIGNRQDFSLVKKGAEKEPSPNEYNTAAADRLLYYTPASFIHSTRRDTILWPSTEETPGPGRYDPSLASSRPSRRARTIHGARRPGDHTLGPFALF